MVQGPPALAKQLGEAYPGFDVVVATSETVDPLNHEPEPLNGGKTLLVSIGKKGKYVGALGFFPAETPRVRFELVTLDKRFEGGGAPMKKLIEDDYRGMLKVAKTVENYGKRQFYRRGTRGRTRRAVTCKECHPRTFAFWSGTKHAALPVLASRSQAQFRLRRGMCLLPHNRVRVPFGMAIASPDA